MRSPVFSVLGAFLFVAVFSPFVLMFAGPVLTGDPDAAQVGLYLLVNVNPVAIPSLLFLLGVAWAFRCLTATTTPAAPQVAVAPRPPARAYRPAVAASKRRTTDHRDVVIDVAPLRSDARSGLCGGPRLAAPAAKRPVILLQARQGPQSR